MRVLLPSPAGRRVGDEGLATKEKTANPILQLEASESDGTGHLMQALEACLVVECDGSAHNSNGQWQHDQVRDAYMLSQGLRVLRFSNDQILNDTENVLREIAEYLVPSDQKPSN